MDQTTVTIQLSTDQYEYQYQFSTLFIICIEIVLTNCYLIWILLRSKCNGNKKRVKIFIVSLSLSDLLVGTIVTPFAVTLLITDRWIFGRTFCIIWQICDQFSSTTCTLTLCVISVDRYWALKAPINHNFALKKRSVYLIVTLIWLISLLVTIVPFILHHFTDFDNEAWTTCASNDHHPLYVLFLLLVSFVLPFTALIFVNYSTYRIVIKQIFTVRTLSKEMRSDAPMRNSTLDLTTATYKQFKLTITLGLIVGCFTIAWTPYFFSYGLYHFCMQCVTNPGLMFKVTSWLAWTCSGVNPLIYMAMNYETFFSKGSLR